MSSQENVVDIIVNIYKRMSAGESLQEISADDFKQFPKTEFIAAYSFILENMSSETYSKKNLQPRILHLAERLVLTKEAYGYLLDLYKLGIISALDMEHIIEKTMINSMTRITLDMMKSLVAKFLFQNQSANHTLSTLLKGNEKIN